MKFTNWRKFDMALVSVNQYTSNKQPQQHSSAYSISTHTQTHAGKRITVDVCSEEKSVQVYTTLTEPRSYCLICAWLTLTILLINENKSQFFALARQNEAKGVSRNHLEWKQLLIASRKAFY